MKKLINLFKLTIDLIIRIFRIGGWAPLLVFFIHEAGANIFNVYNHWPAFDVPMHFFGGLAIAFFFSRLFQTLPRELPYNQRVVVLEMILILSLTATAAVFWEFLEFGMDQTLGTNVQVSLANTMKDMALGIAGGCLYILLRMKTLRASFTYFIELAEIWIRGDVEWSKN